MGRKVVYEIALDPIPSPQLWTGKINKKVYVICDKLKNPNDAIYNYRRAYPSDQSIFLHARALEGDCALDNSPV